MPVLDDAGHSVNGWAIPADAPVAVDWVGEGILPIRP